MTLKIMTQKIAKIVMPKKKDDFKIKMKTGYICIYIGSVAFCMVVQPDYSPKYSFRENLYNGYKRGIVSGVFWPITMPLIIYRLTFNSFGVSPIEESEKLSKDDCE
jgi:hypothetical protein